MTANDSTASYGDIVRRLAGAQKVSLPGSPPYSIFVNRKAGRLIAAWAFRAGLTPNAVTAISACLTFAGILCIALIPPAPWSGLIVWFLLALGYAFDSADGQVARLRGGGSPAGEWLDHVVDCAKLSSLHIAVAIAMFRWFELPSGWLLLPLLYAVVSAVTFFGMILNDLLRQARGGGRARETGERSVAHSILILPTDYGILCLVFLLLGWPMWFTVAYGLFFIANLGALAIALPRWFGQMKQLGKEVR